MLWLRDSVAVALGTKISVQSNGEFFEYVLNHGDEKIRSLVLLGTVTSIRKRKNSSVVNSFSIYPTPAQSQAIIQYGIKQSAFVSLKIYDILGSEVKTSVNCFQNSGNYVIKLNGKNNQGNFVSDGVYIFKLQIASSEKRIRKLLFFK